MARAKRLITSSDMRADEMGAEDATAALLDQGFVAVHGFTDPAGRVPVRDLLAIKPGMRAPLRAPPPRSCQPRRSAAA